MEPLTVRVELRPDPFHTLPVSHSRFSEDLMAVHPAVVCRSVESGDSRNNGA
jgi:hypothetical protein